MPALARPAPLLLAAALLLTLGGCLRSTPPTPAKTSPACPSSSRSPPRPKCWTTSGPACRPKTQSRAGGGFSLFPAAAPGGASEDDGASGDYSTTNLQEAGVDESDVFKSDGTYFYLARQNSVRILQADPLAELAEIGRIDLDSAVDSLYLYGDTLIALGSSYGAYGYSGGMRDPAFDAEMWPPYYSTSEITITQIDITVPASRLCYTSWRSTARSFRRGSQATA